MGMVGATKEWWTSLNYVMNYVCVDELRVFVITMRVCELICVQVDDDLFV